MSAVTARVRPDVRADVRAGVCAGVCARSRFGAAFHDMTGGRVVARLFPWDPREQWPARSDGPVRMTLTWKSRVVSASSGDAVGAEVSRARTCGPLGTSSNRGADATVRRRGRAGRPVAGLLAAVALVGAAGCDYRESGNGKYYEAPIHPADFAGVRTEDGIDAVITISSTATQTVILTGDENIVKDNLRWSVDPEQVGSTSIQILHVWASPRFDPVIPARVVVTRPSLALVGGEGGVDLQISGTPGWTAPGPLHVELDGATLTASDYAVDGAVVELERGSLAVLHSDGPVGGTVAADSQLDNRRGSGSCAAVATSGSGNVRCN